MKYGWLQSEAVHFMGIQCLLCSFRVYVCACVCVCVYVKSWNRIWFSDELCEQGRKTSGLHSTHDRRQMCWWCCVEEAIHSGGVNQRQAYGITPGSIPASFDLVITYVLCFHPGENRVCRYLPQAGSFSLCGHVSLLSRFISWEK